MHKRSLFKCKKLAVNHIYLKPWQLCHELCCRVARIFTVQGWEPQ